MTKERASLMTTRTKTPSRDEFAAELASFHFELDSAISKIFRVMGSRESDPKESVKLLEVKANTVAVGIMPVSFGANAANGAFYPCVIVEITPDEFRGLQEGRLRLPDDWTLGMEYNKG
jgi:hypothetical protein